MDQTKHNVDTDPRAKSNAGTKIKNAHLLNEKLSMMQNEDFFLLQHQME